METKLEGILFYIVAGKAFLRINFLHWKSSRFFLEFIKNANARQMKSVDDKSMMFQYSELQFC